MDPIVLGIVGVLLLGGAWLAWRTAKAVVRAGYFVLAFAAGSIGAWLLLETYGREPSIPTALGAGLAVAWGWQLIRSRVARWITLIALAVALRFIPDLGRILGPL